MAMKQCSNNHLYDDQKNASCPYCSGIGDIGVLRPLSNANGSNSTSLKMNAPSFPQTAPLHSTSKGTEIPKTMPLNNPDINKTVALNINENGINPVCGWLICVNGEKKGKDFSIHGEKNFIGRSKSNDICFDFDNSISKEANAIISYDKRNNKFFIYCGEGKNNIYVNESLLLRPLELKDYDIVEVGKTKLMFFSLCNSNFKWD